MHAPLEIIIQRGIRLYVLIYLLQAALGGICFHPYLLHLCILRDIY